jgi:ATP-dependent helicase Lhr and Lhr-like helicase
MSDAQSPLSSFHPLVREWFLERYGSPTPVQREAWPAIASGKHVLALAPTGSGKTLTAFLGAISRIASGELPSEGLSVLYVSPLKALGEDVRRNLETPLAELGGLFRARGEAWPGIRAATRSGDTSQADRRRMLKAPPSILATTPESLALMLDSSAARAMLSGVRLLVLDEIHALAGDKRGAMLASSVGRLALLAGEFQRVALSATARPVEAIASFVGGRRLSYDSRGRAAYERRQVLVVAPPSEKRIELRVEWPLAPVDTGEGAAPSRSRDTAPRYAAIVPEIVRKLGTRGTQAASEPEAGDALKEKEAPGLLVFTDSRRRAERLAFLLNEAMGEGSAWAHHGSLSREARRVVEERFKAGELGCVVATASLELGIDIGSVGEVLLAGTPGSVASALQRIGRSGHGVGEASKGSLYPFHGMDLVLAAAAAKGVEERAVEETRPLSCPLDVLAQVLLQLTLEPELDLAPPREIDALYDIVLSFPPFERLTRGLFDSTLQMLAGKYSGSRLRELEPRLAIDAATGTARAAKGARGILYSSGGTIPDRGLFSMRVAGSKTKIGELDEEFVFERKVGEVFALGAQTWRIRDIGDEAVFVESAPPDPDIIPFWKGDPFFRSPELSSRALELLDRLGREEAASRPDSGAALLEEEYYFSAPAAQACARFVSAQASAGLGRPSLPGLRRIVLEVNEESSSGSRSSRQSCRLVLHSLRGRAINEPLGLALCAAMEEELGLPVQRLADDDLILFVVPRTESPDPASVLLGALAGLAKGDRLEKMLKACLESSGIFGAQFRENAARALLLPRGMPGKRMPLWMSRLRAKKLFTAMRSHADFPIIVETWRSCLSDLFDLEGARALARAVAEGRIEVSTFASRAPSPFAREVVWQEINDNMYRNDELEARASSSVSDRVVAEALRSATLRPRLEASLVSDFEARLKRLVPGWAPEDAFALAEWARERVLIPVSELPAILDAAGGGLAEELGSDPSCGGRLVRTRLGGASEEVLVHAERVEALSADPASHIAEWLRREAAVSRERIARLFGLAPSELAEAIEGLVEEGAIVDDFLIGDEDSGGNLIDAQNLEILLRRSRAASRPAVVARPAKDLARLVLAAQGIPPALTEPGTPGSAAATAALARALASLEGASLPASLWETEILPLRVARYRSADLDALLSSSPWQWFGSGRGMASLAEVADLELFLPRRRARSELVPSGGGRHDFWSIRELSGLGSAQAARRLWDEAWKGLVASDSFADLREGIADSFGADLPEVPPASGGPEEGREGRTPFGSPRRIPRALRERWRGGAPLAGRWFALDFDEEGLGMPGEAGLGESDRLGEPDLLGKLGLDAARVRILASRYALLCRSMLEREAPALRWAELFPAMRRLELAGELLSGRFFEGIDGPQFLDPAAFKVFLALGEASPSTASPNAPAWINALDPAASALYAAAQRPVMLPQRVAANRICLDGGDILAISTRSYRELSLAVAPEDPRLGAILGLFRGAREREVRPERRIVVEIVNGSPAAASPFAAALAEAGFEADRGRMVLW